MNNNEYNEAIDRQLDADEERSAEQQARLDWLDWIGAGCPSDDPPSMVTLQMICMRCGQVMRCMPEECAPRDQS